VRKLTSRKKSSSPSSSVPPSPYAPRILSVQENQWVHQSLLLVFGQVGVVEKPCNGLITVHHHLDGYPSTQWSISEGYFKALVRLDPGPNKIRFEYNASKIPSFSTCITLNMLPLTASPPLHLAVLLGKDSTGEYECQGERKEHEGNGIEMAQKKLRMAAHLVQVNQYCVLRVNVNNIDLQTSGLYRGTDVQESAGPQMFPAGRRMGFRHLVKPCHEWYNEEPGQGTRHSFGEHGGR